MGNTKASSSKQTPRTPVSRNTLSSQRGLFLGISFGSLFTGIGGLDLAMEQLGFQCAWQVEIHPYRRQVLQRHWPDVTRYEDVRTLTVDTVVSLAYDELSKSHQEAVDMGAKRKDYDLAVELYNQGLSIGDVAAYYEMSRQAMWMILKRRDCTFREQQRHGSENHFYRGGSVADDQAQNLLERAVEKGIIQRKDVCESCGASGTMKDGRSLIQAHHLDYNKPLDVMWWCQPCHHDWHKWYSAIPRKEVVQEASTVVPDTDMIVAGFP